MDLKTQKGKLNNAHPSLFPACTRVYQPGAQKPMQDGRLAKVPEYFGNLVTSLRCVFSLYFVIGSDNFFNKYLFW